MDLETINSIKPLIELGMIPMLLLLFVKFFFDKYKQLDKQWELQLGELRTQNAKREELLRAESGKREEQYKEREKILFAESARREEILKKESEKREKIIRDESAKREASLLVTIDSFSKTMKEISVTMTEIKKATFQANYKIESIETTLGQLQKGGAESGQKA